MVGADVLPGAKIIILQSMTLFVLRNKVSAVATVIKVMEDDRIVVRIDGDNAMCPHITILPCDVYWTLTNRE